MGVSKEIVNISTLPTDEYAASMGLAFTPDLPIIIRGSNDDDTNDAEVVREENRKKKNTNRSLDKLKKQIKEQKALRKAMREEESNRKKLKKVEDQAAKDDDSNDNSDRDSNSDKDGEGGLFNVKQIHTWNGNEDEDDEDDKMEIINRTMRDTISLKKQKEKKQKIKIRSDGTTRGGERSGKTLTSFNEDGEMIEDPLRHMVEELNHSKSKKKNKDLKDQLSEIEEHTRRVKQRVDEGRREDTLREKERIKAKHVEERNYGKKKRDEEYNDDVIDAPMLSNYVEQKSSSDSDSNSNDDDDDDDDNHGFYSSTNINDFDDKDLENQEALALQLLSGK